MTNLTNQVDLVDLTNKTVVDQDENSEEESTASKNIFYDVVPDSSPEIIDVETVDGLTVNERWLLTYDGVLPGSYTENATIAGTTLTDATTDFVALGVAAGDIVVINPFEGTMEEVSVANVTDANNLELTTVPNNTGASIKYQIRSSNNYIIMGSVSGLQLGRVVEGTPYTTDSGSLSLNIIPSLNHPTTQGDYFTFTTDDGIDSIVLRDKSLPMHLTRVERVSDGEEYVYVANEGSDDVSIIGVSSEREKDTLD